MWKSLLLLACAIPAVAGDARWVNQRQVVLSCEAAGAVDKSRLWVSCDDGKHWTAAEHRFDAGRIYTTLAADGRWSFFIVLENAAGASAAPPVDGTTPQATLIVDSAAPTLQILSVRQVHAPAAGDRPQLLLRTVLVDENLGPQAARAYYRCDEDQTWRDGGPLDLGRVGAGRELSWLCPPDAVRAIQLMLIATDLAGNRASDVTEVITLDTPPAPPASQPASQPGSRLVATSQPASRPATAFLDFVGPPDVAALRRAAALRQRAEHRLLTGDLDLALARFDQAVALDPNDFTTINELGAALLRANRLDEARDRFDRALNLSSNNIDALEGLAQVAVGQQRFNDARDLLRQIVARDPASARTWLRLGDVEFKLGRRTEGIAAWRKAAETGTNSGVAEKADARLKAFADSHDADGDHARTP